MSLVSTRHNPVITLSCWNHLKVSCKRCCCSVEMKLFNHVLTQRPGALAIQKVSTVTGVEPPGSKRCRQLQGWSPLGAKCVDSYKDGAPCESPWSPLGAKGVDSYKDGLPWKQKVSTVTGVEPPWEQKVSTVTGMEPPGRVALHHSGTRGGTRPAPFQGLHPCNRRHFLLPGGSIPVTVDTFCFQGAPSL